MLLLTWYSALLCVKEQGHNSFDARQGDVEDAVPYMHKARFAAELPCATRQGLTADVFRLWVRNHPSVTYGDSSPPGEPKSSNKILRLYVEKCAYAG